MRGIVSALSIFVPGIGSVSAWRNKSPKISDLSLCKLIGLSKTCTISKAVEVCCSFGFFFCCLLFLEICYNF